MIFYYDDTRWRHDRPMTPQKFTEYMTSMGWELPDIGGFLGFDPPTTWAWKCRFCSKHGVPT